MCMYVKSLGMLALACVWYGGVLVCLLNDST